MILKKYTEFINENTASEGSFIVYENMVENGRFKEGIIPDIINGDFNCDEINLTTLEGGPKEVKGNFNCDFNKLTNLKYLPLIGESISCEGNQLTSLEGCPSKINGDLYCNNNQLTSLKGGPDYIDGNFVCVNNKLKSLEFCPSIEFDYDYTFDSYLKTELKYIQSKHINVDNYWLGLLQYMIKKDKPLDKIKGWPEGFLSDNLVSSAKGINKFKL